MSLNSRPLEIRLREFIEHGRKTSAALVRVADDMDERFPEESSTGELRAIARTQVILCDDLDKMLAGEELKGWDVKMSGEEPRT